jgi:hypothetical protein
VPIVGGVQYVRTGVLKWWVGGVMMGGWYMICGTFPLNPSKFINIAKEVNRPKTKVHGWEMTAGRLLNYLVITVFRSLCVSSSDAIKESFFSAERRVRRHYGSRCSWRRVLRKQVLQRRNKRRTYPSV